MSRVTTSKAAAVAASNSTSSNSSSSSSHAAGVTSAVVSTSRKVDDRIRLLLDDVVSHKHRGLVLLVGDRAKDQIVNLHTMLSRANHNAKVSVLWCMKDDPDFGSTSAKKQERRARREVKGGLATEATKEAFQTFLAQTNIRFCKYAETHAILGQTFGMAVLQDFESLTPNTLARTVETVSGGGLVVLVFRGLRSLKQLHTIAMDVHARYRTAAQRDVVPRFNERFVLSLTDCDTALCVDDDLNVLPITQKMRSYGSTRRRHNNSDDNDSNDDKDSDKDKAKSKKNKTSSSSSDYDKELVLQGQLRHEAELATVKATLKASSEVGPLVQLCQTMDQAKTVLALMQAVTEKALDATCVVTASRGRGKSAALGMAAAGAVAQGYSNILCTAPSPENVQTFFEFVVRGLCALGYTERVDFEAMRGTSDEFKRCLIRVNVFRGHRQTVQFVAASDAALFAQAELAIIDEAAALPLPLVRQMLGPYLVFLSSTVAGYEGTGRSLSLKLIADMRKRSGAAVTPATESNSNNSNNSNNSSSSNATTTTGRRVLREMVMQDPIRYGPADPVERWLHTLLCLDATTLSVPLRSTPHPDACELFYVNRDALFSYHPLAEALLQRVQALLVAAHYKNQPNDLQLLSDAPGHHLFVLCSRAAVEEQQSGGGAGAADRNDDRSSSNAHVSTATAARQQTSSSLPDVYCVVHVCEEGQLSATAVKQQLSRGLRPSGDLIPYTLSQYFLEDGFAQLAGVRVVRIATHPEVQRGGYGSRAVQLLRSYYAGNIAPTPRSLDTTSKQQQENDDDNDDNDDNEEATTARARRVSDAVGTTATATAASSSSALLTPLAERPYEVVDYVGVSFGLTSELFAFWQRGGFVPLYLRQAANELTGEHSCVMVHPLGFDVTALQREFARRLVHLLAAPFRQLPAALALCVLLGSTNVHDPQRLAQLTDTHAAATRRVVRVAGVVQATAAAAMAAAELTPADVRRLRLYTTAFVEGASVLDLVPRLARLYFSGCLYVAPDGSEGVVLSHAQAAVLLAVGLQCITLEELARQSAFASVSVQQLRAFYRKAIARITEHLVRLGRLDDAAVAPGKRPRAAAAADSDNNDNNDDDEGSVVAAEDGDPTAATSDGHAGDGGGAEDAGDEAEEAVERYDAQGRLVGLSVARTVRPRVCVDSTLLRDASGAVMGASDAAAHANLQHVFHKKRKTSASRRRA